MTNKEFIKKYEEIILNSLAKGEKLTHCLRDLCDLEGIEYNNSMRVLVYRYIDIRREGTLQPIETKEEVYNEPGEFPTAWDKVNNRYLSLEEYCIKYNIDIKTVKAASLSGAMNRRNYTIRFKNREELNAIDVESAIESSVKNHIKPVETKFNLKTKNKATKDFDRLVYTDVHIGMNVNGSDKNPLYEGKWDKEELLRRLDAVVEHVLEEQESYVLYIDDLGDYLDGLSGFTTRGGHKLPQNMTDNEVFDLGVLFKVKLVEKLLPYYEKIICHSVVNDNHSGIFSSFVNKTVKNILELKYPKLVEYHILDRFIDYYVVGDNHVFVLCHGKDAKEMSFGFKPILDSKQIEKIDNFLKEEDLYDFKFIEFSKGDSHQGIFDETTSNHFFYYTYPAFSEPSNWVKTNFKNTISGFRFFSFNKDKRAGMHKPFYFNKK